MHSFSRPVWNQHWEGRCPAFSPTLYHVTVTGYHEFQTRANTRLPSGRDTHSRPMVTTLDSSTPALRVKGLRKAYDDVVAVDGLDLEVAIGECFGLLGPNGAGKTTTIEICEGLLPADSGSVEVLGRRWESDARELRELLGIQLQEPHFSKKLPWIGTLSLLQISYSSGTGLGKRLNQLMLELNRIPLYK